MLLWDGFVLEHKLANGRTVVEQIVAANPAPVRGGARVAARLAGRVQGPFEVLGREGPAQVVQSLVDELTYRVRSNRSRASSRRTPRGSFIIARFVAVGDEWMLSGPIHLLRAAERDIAYRLAMDMALRTPEAVFRNSEKLALAWEQQRAVERRVGAAQLHHGRRPRVGQRIRGQLSRDDRDLLRDLIQDLRTSPAVSAATAPTRHHATAAEECGMSGWCSPRRRASSWKLISGIVLEGRASSAVPFHTTPIAWPAG